MAEELYENEGDAKKPGTKAHQIRLTDDEWNSICAAAKRSRLGPARYLVRRHEGSGHILSAEQLVALTISLQTVQAELHVIGERLVDADLVSASKLMRQLITIERALRSSLRKVGLAWSSHGHPTTARNGTVPRKQQSTTWRRPASPRILMAGPCGLSGTQLRRPYEGIPTSSWPPSMG